MPISTLNSQPPRPTKAGEAFTTFAIWSAVRSNGYSGAALAGQQMSKRWLLLVQAAPSSFLRPDAITVTLPVGAGEICPVTSKWGLNLSQLVTDDSLLVLCVL